MVLLNCCFHSCPSSKSQNRLPFYVNFLRWLCSWSRTSCNSPLITSVVITVAFEWRKNTSFLRIESLFLVYKAPSYLFIPPVLFLLCRAKFVGKFSLLKIMMSVILGAAAASGGWCHIDKALLIWQTTLWTGRTRCHCWLCVIKSSVKWWQLTFSSGGFRSSFLFEIVLHLDERFAEAKFDNWTRFEKTSDCVLSHGWHGLL